MKNIAAKGLHTKLDKHCFLSAFTFTCIEEKDSSVNISIFHTLTL